MTINSKQKGKRFELKLASIFREQGYDARRTAQYCGNTGEAADVVGLPRIHVEAKHVERLNIYDAMAQAKRDAEASGKGNLPAVFHKKNHSEVLVTMTLDDWFSLYREWDSEKALEMWANMKDEGGNTNGNGDE
jgi:hypothetical protein